jgi:hypothetical protein
MFSPEKFIDKEPSITVTRNDLIRDIYYGDTDAQDQILDCFLGVGDPEPLREALVLWAKNPNDVDAIGKLVIKHLNRAYDRATRWA